MTPAAANDNWQPGTPVPAGYYRSSMYPDRLFRRHEASAPVQSEATEGLVDLAERRAWLATLPDKWTPVLAWPTAERLSRLDSPEAAKALYGYAELMLPLHMVPANDNLAPKTDLDTINETRPSIGEIMRAASDGLRCSVTSSRVDGAWRVTARRETAFGQFADGFRVGHLLFRKGELVSFGKTGKGKSKTPVERKRGPKGGKSAPARSVRSIRYLLPANDNTPIARNSLWLGGISRAKGNTTRPDIGDHDASVEMDRNRRRQAIRLALGREAAVLDAAITDASAAEIGAAFGYTGKTAERQGIKKINAAVEKLRSIAA